MRNLKKRLERLESERKLRGRKEQENTPYADVYPPDWSPKSAAQKAALESIADILLFGGAAGSLKTETMMVDAGRECLNPNLRAIIFRSRLTQMSDIVDKSYRLYKPLRAEFSQSSLTWAFPSGATIRFAYIAVDNDIFEYLGPRYSFIGFDESTFFSEYQIRNMLGRLSSTDPRLRLRTRLASNPGGIGAAWHKAIFLRGSCPVHNPDVCAKNGELYWDARWPSDGYRLSDDEARGLSVAFIPGRLTDHKLVDEKYADRLRMMSGSLSKKMEQGCWCALDGAYFSIWDANKMVVPYGSVREHWWDAHFISLDFGFGKSSAAAHLHVRTKDGRITTIGEFVAQHLCAEDFAREVVSRFVLAPLQGKRRKILAVYLDPANFHNVGTGHTIAGQINEVLGPCDLGAIPAANDRSGGWQHMYRTLQTGEWRIADTCPMLIKSIPSRMHDEKRPADVLKVLGDPLDDVADSARYGLYTFITAANIPDDGINYEHLTALARQGDLTSASIRYRQMVEKNNPVRRPVIYPGGFRPFG